MFAFANNAFLTPPKKQNLPFLSNAPGKKRLNNVNLLELNKAQQQSLEQQIAFISTKISTNSTNKNNKRNMQSPLLLEQIKFLAVKLSLKTAEERALTGLEVESILRSIRNHLIEEKASFPINIKWLEEEILYIKNLALEY